MTILQFQSPDGADLEGVSRANPLPVTQSAESESRLVGGRSFSAGTGRITLAASGHIRITFANPDGSGRVARLWRIRGGATVTAFATLRLDPTTGLPPPPARPVVNERLDSTEVAVVMLKADTNALTPLDGGTDTGIVIPFFANRDRDLEYAGLWIPPGRMLGVECPFSGAGDLAATFFWTEANE